MVKDLNSNWFHCLISYSYITHHYIILGEITGLWLKTKICSLADDSTLLPNSLPNFCNKQPTGLTMCVLFTSPALFIVVQDETKWTQYTITTKQTIPPWFKVTFILHLTSVCAQDAVRHLWFQAIPNLLLFLAIACWCMAVSTVALNLII